MSTRAIREALTMCRALPLADVAMERIDAAQAELEAIEKAARSIATMGVEEWDENGMESIDLMRAIAKETAR